MKKIVLLAYIAMCVSADAYAQYVIGGIRYTCPVGAGWNDPRCIREPVEGSEGFSGAQDQQPSLPTFWGSIAVDPAKQVTGFSNDKKSQRHAERAAVKECKANGGDRCSIAINYFSDVDPCVGMAVGENEKFGTGRGKTEGEALHFAMQACKSQGIKCEIYYAKCISDGLRWR